MSWLSFLFALASGALITFQVGSNSQLKKSLGQPLISLTFNYLVGISAAVTYTLIKREPFPSLSQAAGVPWWGWIGGLFGALYGFTAILLASQMGAATLTAVVVTGQIVASVILDHYGWARIRFSSSQYLACGGLHVHGAGAILGSEVLT
ncbi:MAG: DMT family transporter [Bryobacteraceae bacterium]